MTFQVAEKDAIVVNNADPLGIGRLQVFIYGVHDITGIKTPFENLPWAFSTQPATITSIPAIWSPVKVRHRFTFGKNIESAFATQDALEWHSPSPYLKLTNNRDPRKFLTYDPNQHKFLNETPVDTQYNNYKISELERLKTERESNREVLIQNIKDLESRSNNTANANPTFVNEYNQVKEDLQKAQNDLDNFDSNFTVESKKKVDQLAEEFFSDEYYNNNVKENVSGLTVFELKDTNYPLWKVYFDAYTIPRYNEWKLEQSLRKESLKMNIVELVKKQANSAEKVKNNNTLEKNLNEGKIEVQKELDAVSKEIIDLEKQISELKGSTRNSLNTFESIKQADPRVGRYDEKTGKVYDTQERLIGNWTGSSFYLPGFAYQPGIPIYERSLEGRLTAISHLQAVDNLYSSSGQMSTILDSWDNSSIKKSNENKTWNCDISYETRLKILSKRQSVMQAVKWLRDQISSLFSIESNSAIGQWVKASIKQLTAILKNIQKFLRFVNEIILEIAKITAQIRQLINWILSLPARLLVLLQDCLTHFFNSLSDTFSESISIGGLEGSNVSFSEITELVTQAQSTFQTATETVESTTIVYTEIKTIEATFEKV